jgi:hypothetical protein
VNEIPPPKPKRQYNYSIATKARMAAQKKLRQAKRTAENKKKQVKSQRDKVRYLEKGLKKIEGTLNGKNPSVLTEDDLKVAPKALKEHIEDLDNVIFRPNEGPQTDFLASPERDVLYGGAAGGGKSYALLADLIRYAHLPDHRALLIRRTLDELTELIDKSKQLYPKAFPGAVFKESKSMWVFPSGATAWFSYLDRDKDVTRYQGQAFNWIGIDEITHYPTPFVWEYLRSRLRTTNPEIKPYMRCTANPGGVGGWWVKKMYIDPSPPYESFAACDIDSGEVYKWPPSHERAGQALFQRKFIPARLTDNPYLMQDGQYEAMLRSLPEVERKRLLDGDWEVAEGAAFPEFSRGLHVMQPFEIPIGWQRFRSADYGYASPSCVLWGTVDFDGNIYIYRELYGEGYTGERLARLILEMERTDPPMAMSILDTSCWNKTGLGPSIAETMIRNGVRWLPADRDRISGKVEVHRRLAISEKTAEPKLKIFATCTNLIRTLASIPTSKTNPEDVDTKADDHAYDALRYMIMTRQSNQPTLNKALNRIKERVSYEPVDTTFGY